VRAHALLGVGRYEEAIASADRSLALDRQQVPARYFKAMGLWYLGRYEEAQALLDGIGTIGVEKMDVQVAFLRARILSSQAGGKQEAQREYSNALNLYEAWVRREGQVDKDGVRREGQVDKALKADILINLAAVSKGLGNAEEALREMPGSFEAQFNYGQIALKTLDDAEEALKEMPGSFEAQFNYEIALKTDACSALFAFQRALVVRPNDLYAMTGLGKALGKLNRSQEALETLGRALSVNPSYNPARLAFEEAKKARGTARAKVTLAGTEKGEANYCLPAG
jgi:tetratricopeptide (TPR) repeat protein